MTSLPRTLLFIPITTLPLFGIGWASVSGDWRSLFVAGGTAIAVHALSIARHYALGDLDSKWLPWHVVAVVASLGIVGPVVDAAPHLLAADLATYPLPAMVAGAAPAALVRRIAGKASNEGDRHE